MTLDLPISEELHAIVRANNRAFVDRMRQFLGAPVILQRRSEWLEGTNDHGEPNIILCTKAAHKKPFTFVGREYVREQIDIVDEPNCRFITKCQGTGSAKTLGDYGIILSEFVSNPFPGLYIMPAQRGPGGAYTIGKEITDTLDASPAFRDLLPKGAARKKNLTTFHIEFNGNDIDFVGGNSAAQVGNKRCRHVFLGEQDKLKHKLGREAGTDFLAGERTKGMANTRVHRGSTPSQEGFGIWPHLVGNSDGTGSDCRRRFFLCPHCNSDGLAPWKRFVLIKDNQYNVALPTKFPDGKDIAFAELRWDKEAKRQDGSWDIDRVIRSARFECPYCGGHIRDAEHGPGRIEPIRLFGLHDARQWLDKNGLWIPTRRGEPGHNGFQMSSYYAPMDRDEYGQIDLKSTWGGMAQKFLNAIENGTIGGWINSDLAEVHVSQESGRNKIELSTAPLSQPDWIPVLTADYHKNHPYIWFVVRKWCAFKLLPPPELANGRPAFVDSLESPDNAAALELCKNLCGAKNDLRFTIHDPQFTPIWPIIGEISRLNSANPETGRSPLIDFLLAQEITGEKLVKYFRETAASDTMEFRRLILLAMWEKGGGHASAFRASRGGDSELIAAGYCDLSGEYVWEELAGIIQEFKIGHGLTIPLRAVAIDCGYKEKFDRAVLRHVHESATQFDYHNPTIKTREPVFSEVKLPFSQVHGWNGWQALRGIPSFQPQGMRELGHHVEDPFYGTPEQGTTVVDVLNVPTALFWLRKDDLRQKRTKQIYTVSPNVSFFPKHFLPDGTRTEKSNYRLEDYEKHSNMMIFDEKKRVIRPRYGEGGAQSRRHPDHPDDCETYQVAMATKLEFFDEKK